jgi:hypothetical protein
MNSKPDRREFLRKGGALLAAPLIVPALVTPALADNANFQSQWRFCDKCETLFFNGFGAKGSCPAGGGHNAQGYNFGLPHGNQLGETEKAQVNWRYCSKCFSMYWDGSADMGRCSAGGGHTAQGYKFRLPHDMPGDAHNQINWRYCQKCHVMFYDGFSGKGRCAAGGAHSAYGYNFVLPWDTPPSLSIRSNVTTDGWAPIGGWVQVDAHSDGTYSFVGHMHNSGALNLRYTLACALLTPTGQSFGFARVGHRVDGTETVFGRNRDDNWSIGDSDIEIVRNWDQVQRAQLYWRIVASDTIRGTIENFLEDIAKEGFKRLKQVLDAQPGFRVANFYMKLLQRI